MLHAKKQYCTGDEADCHANEMQFAVAKPPWAQILGVKNNPVGTNLIALSGTVFAIRECQQIC